MIYLKSTIAGVAAVFLAAAVIYTAAVLAIVVLFRSEGVDLPIWHVHTKSPAFWLLGTSGNLGDSQIEPVPHPSDCWRYIAISLIDPAGPVLNEC